jgi:hypothetical protein
MEKKQEGLEKIEIFDQGDAHHKCNQGMQRKLEFTNDVC